MEVGIITSLQPSAQWIVIYYLNYSSDVKSHIVDLIPWMLRIDRLKSRNTDRWYQQYLTANEAVYYDSDVMNSKRLTHLGIDCSSSMQCRPSCLRVDGHTGRLYWYQESRRHSCLEAKQPDSNKTRPLFRNKSDQKNSAIVLKQVRSKKTRPLFQNKPDSNKTRPLFWCNCQIPSVEMFDRIEMHASVTMQLFSASISQLAETRIPFSFITYLPRHPLISCYHCILEFLTPPTNGMMRVGRARQLSKLCCSQIMTLEMVSPFVICKISTFGPWLRSPLQFSVKTVMYGTTICLK